MPIILETLKKAESEKNLGFLDLSPLHTFEWLLTEPQKMEVKAMTDKLLAAVTSSAKKRVWQGAGAGEGVPKKSKPASSKDGLKQVDKLEEASNDVMSLFN